MMNVPRQAHSHLDLPQESLASFAALLDASSRNSGQSAGITRDAPLHKMTPKQWHEVIAVDLGSCFTASA
ncbi:MAG: hypothetical protein AB7F22_02465 [Reyranella sp.]